LNAVAGDDRPPVTGVCIVRAVRGTAPQIRLTVIVNLDVEQLSGETTHECPDRAAVFAVVTDFLDRYDRGVGGESGQHSTG
jgi:hypothetical protein